MSIAGISRTRRLVLIAINNANVKKTHWIDEYPDSLISMKRIKQVFESLYSKGKINTSEWYTDNITIIERKEKVK